MIRQLLERAKTRSDVFAANVGLALLTGAVGCSQAIGCNDTFYYAYYLRSTGYSRRRCDARL